MKMTSALANKMIKKLNEDKAYWTDQEVSSYLYTAAADEEPVIPEYDYEKVSKEIAEIDRKVEIIRHAINLSNATAQVQVGEEVLSVDVILVRMAQLNSRKRMLDVMRKQQPKKRVSSGYLAAKKTAPEYEYINYDLDVVKADYDKIDGAISQMQLALDKYNQTVEFEVEI